jgi:thiamine-monophosphate kinase
MGATPLGITVGLGLPGNVQVDWVEHLYQGMTACLQQYNTPILGGDIVRSPVTTVAITAFGTADPNLIIRRSAAQVGDAIVITGYHGASRAGLELLLNPQVGESLSPEQKSALIEAHQRPNPRLDVLPLLKQVLTTQVVNNSLPLRIAGMDSSDGLADAVLQICHASHVGAVLEYDQIPVPSAFNNWLTKERALEYVLYGGEDFELVLCLPSTLAGDLVQQLELSGQGVAIIGTIQSNQEVILRDRNHHYQQQQQIFPERLLDSNLGFHHF